MKTDKLIDMKTDELEPVIAANLRSLSDEALAGVAAVLAVHKGYMELDRMFTELEMRSGK